MRTIAAKWSSPATRQLICAVVLATLGAAAATPMRAQAPAAPTSSYAPVSAGCDYQRCALGIAPVWNGLAVVRGAEREQVANLSFFWPVDLEAPFRGDSARAYALRAVHTRRVAATLTDAGALLMAVAVLRGVQTKPLDGIGRAAAIAGAAAFVLSVPLHFRADGWLSRAVWWHNASAAAAR
jgi:hypothetical protein